MTKLNLVRREKTWGDTAVDGLVAGLAGGVVMSLFLVLAVWAGDWLTGLLAHLAVSAIYGVGLALLLRGVGWLRPSLTRLAWLWGGLYGLLLWGLAVGVMVTAVDSFPQIPTWEFGLAHLLYGLVAGYRLQKVQ